MPRRMAIFLATGIAMLLTALVMTQELWIKDGTNTLPSNLDAGVASHSELASVAAPSEILPLTAYTLTVTSADMSGNSKTGMYTTVREGSSTVKTGYTPLSFEGRSGVAYSISVSNYQSSIFDHWENQSTNSRRTVTLTGDVTLTAYYQTASTVTPPGPLVPTSSGDLIPQTGVLVPLYMYPGTTGSVHWQKVIDEKIKHPSVPIVAIFNPSSGPGSAKDNNIAGWVNKLQSAGIIAIGYTPDGYADTKNPGTRTMTYMKDAIKKYHDWYDADGIFFDEFSNKSGYEGRYIELTRYAKSLGMKLTVGNAGASGSESYVGTVDVLNITEGRGYIPIYWLQNCTTCSAEKGWQHQHDRHNFAMIRYDIAQLDVDFVKEASNWVGLMYITDGNDSNNRWMHIPPYFGEIVSVLAS
jgi:hypothetical protein